MSSIGERLREERLRRGLTVEQIAEQTKINPALLEAVESDRFDRLPGAFFTRSFIRQYAGVLELDPERLEPELSQLTGFEKAPVAEPDPEFRPQIERGSVRGGLGRGGYGMQNSLGAAIVFVLILAACSGLYTLWERRKARLAAEEQRAALELPAPTPTPAQPTAAPETVPESAVPTPTPTETPAEAPPADPNAPPPEVSASEQPTPAVVTPGEAGTAPPTPAADAPAATGPVQLQIRATAMTWLRLTAGERLVYEGVMNANDSRQFQSQQPLTLKTGNAGGLDIVWNGKSAGPFGKVGDVRTVEFSPGSFRVVPPPPPAKPPADLP